MSFVDNLKSVWKKASFWVATVGAALVAAWPVMPADLQAQLMHSIPMLQLIAPGIWLVSFVVARAVPQKTPE